MSNFKKYKFSELYAMSSGISSKPEQAGHGFPFLSFKAVFNNYFLPDELADLMDTPIKDRNSSSIKKGDIFLTRTSETLDELGMSSVATKDYPDATFSGFLKRLRPLQDDVTYDKYMAFYLRSKYFRKIMTNNSIMTLRASLNEQIFSYLNLILPEYEIQKSIGDLLYSLNQKIEVNNKINTELEAMAKTLYDYWFVQFDFPNEEGKPYKASGGKMIYDEVFKREIPEGWEVKDFGDLFDVKRGTLITRETSTEGNYKVVAAGLNHSYLTGEYNRDEFTITVSGSGANAGYVNFWTEKIFASDCTTIRGGNNLETFIALFFLKMHQSYILSQAKGSAQPHVYPSDITALKFTNPSDEVKVNYGKLLIPLFEKIKNIEKLNQELVQLRDWLLPMLMNGQVSIQKLYSSKEAELPQLAMAAEPVMEYGEIIKLSIPDKSKVFAKQVLGGKIVSLFKDDPNFTHIKFQKLQYLAEHIAEADLDLNYYFQTAGPHDGRFMHTIANKLKTSKWFEERNYKFYPLEKQDKIDGYYQGYFAPVQDRLDKLFHLLADATPAEAEIIATLYAVWNNRIILKQPISETNIIEDFYKWSDRKLQYSKDRLLKSLEILRNNQIVPTGFGKEIKTAKNKSK